MLLLLFGLVTCFSLAMAETGQGISPLGTLDSRERNDSDFARQFNQAFSERLGSAANEEAPPNLAFRAFLADENRNGILEPGENTALVVTIVNTGKGPAQDVKISLSGSSVLAGMFEKLPGPATIPPEHTISETAWARMPKPVTAENGRVLIVHIAEAHPEWSPTNEAVLPVAISDKPVGKKGAENWEAVDVVPPRRLTTDAAIAVVIGIGQYRSRTIAALPDARHDAEVMLQYFENVCGVKPENAFALYDQQATRTALDSLFGSQLSGKIMPGDRLYIYFAGLGAQGRNRAPLLAPYDAVADSEGSMYPIEKLKGEVAQWGTEQTLILLDAGFSGNGRVLYARAPEEQGADVVGPHPAVNLVELAGSDQYAIIAASDSTQGAGELPQAEHGLFTYCLLKGLRGDADNNPADGWVTVKELYDYLRTTVSLEALARLDRYQDPVMLLPKEVLNIVSDWRVSKSQ
jgi:hypothetical protein